MKFEYYISYVNSGSRHSELSSTIYIQKGSASFIFILTELRKNNRNTNMGLGMVGIPYGISEKAELYGNVSYLLVESRNLNGMLKIKPRIRAYKI